MKKEMATFGIVGYGPSFGMGKHHSDLINSTQGLKVISVCDKDPVRVEEAKKEFPDVETYTDVNEFLKKSKADVAVVITPHNTHKDLVVACLQAGKSVIVEKPMCLSLKEADEMIETAEKNNLMLSVFHNRRWDGDFLTIEEIVRKGTIGKVFNLEMYIGGYSPQREWWRSDMAISGGRFYDWAAHLLYWVLLLIPSKIKQVYGFSQKRVWRDVSNEDEVKCVIRFENGEVADIQDSSISAVLKLKWRILGEKGGISGNWVDEEIRVFEYTGTDIKETIVKIKPSQWNKFYHNIADHLLRGEPLEITPFMARRVIGVIEKTMESAEKGIPVDFE